MTKINSIIKRMKQLWEVRKFVKYIDTRINKFDLPEEYYYKGYLTYLVDTNKVYKQYEKETGKTEQEISNYLTRALKEKYLVKETPSLVVSYLGVDPDKGRHFLGEFFLWEFPTGYIDELLKQYNITVTVIIGSGLLSAIGYGIWYLFKLIFK